MEKALELIAFLRYYIVPTAILLGILIFVHEFGHFIVAKLSGVRILKFSLGFGPKIIGKKIGYTEYRISLLPLGGYVKPLGESPDEPVAEEDKPFSLTHQSIPTRLAIIAAGSVFNIAFACLLFIILFMVGTPMLTPKVGKVLDNSPAQRAGLQEKGFVDQIMRIQVGGKDDEHVEWHLDLLACLERQVIGPRFQRDDPAVE